MGNWYGRRKRRAELSIYLAFRSVFWRIVFDWLPSDTKRAVSCEMHQDFGANARVPPKRALGRLENASSAVSLPNQCPGPPPSLSVHYLYTQSVPFSAKPQYNAFNKTSQNVPCSTKPSTYQSLRLHLHIFVPLHSGYLFHL